MKKLNSSELKSVNGGAKVKKAINKQISKSSKTTTAKKGYSTAIKKAELPKKAKAPKGYISGKPSSKKKK